MNRTLHISEKSFSTITKWKKSFSIKYLPYFDFQFIYLLWKSYWNRNHFSAKAVKDTSLTCKYSLFDGYPPKQVHLKDDAMIALTNVNFMIGWEQNEVEPSLLMIFSHEWPRYLTLVL